MSLNGRSEAKWPELTVDKINLTLNKGLGAAKTFKELEETYGPPQGRWGPTLRLVMRQRKAANASIRMGTNGATIAPVNAQSNADGNASRSNSGSKTGSVALHSTPNVPMVIVRESDAIIRPQDQLPINAMYPDAADVLNFQLVVRDPLFQQFAQPWRMQYQPAPPPPKPDFWQEVNADMLRNMKYMMEMCMYISMIRVFHSK